MRGEIKLQGSIVFVFPEGLKEPILRKEVMARVMSSRESLDRQVVPLILQDSSLS